jgi:TldD protein
MKIEKHAVRDIPRRKFLELSMKGGLLIAATPALMAQLVSCQNGAKIAAGLDMDKETLSKVIAKALEKGGDFADVYLEHRISRQIVIKPVMLIQMK